MRKILAALIYLAAPVAAIAQAGDLSDLRRGDMATIALHSAPRATPDVAFATPDGSAQLADFAGQVTLVNFWATWCPPCREEMPSINALAGSIDGLEVVTIGTARTKPGAADRFLTQIGADALPRYTDPDGLARHLGIMGLPVTIILDRNGQEIARLTGDADWNSPEARALLEAIVAQDAAP